MLTDSAGIPETQEAGASGVPAAPFLSVVVPAYNEALRLAASLDRIREYLEQQALRAEVIVVDDGSTDATPELVLKAAASWPSVRLVRNGRNRGKGFSVRRGALEARGQYVLFTDADLSASIDQAGVLMAALESTGADAAIGSRALRRELIGVHQPRLREWAGVCFNRLVRLFTGLKLYDTQCGLKLFRRETTRRAFEYQKAEGFGFDPEVLFLIERWGGRVLEVPVRWDHNPASKVRLGRDGTETFFELVALRWRVWTRQYPPAERVPASPPACQKSTS